MSRHFENTAFGHEMPANLLTMTNEGISIKDDVKAKLKRCLNDMLQEIDHADCSFDARDNSVYTGMTGYALLYLHMYEVFNHPSHLTLATSYVAGALEKFKRRRITFLCGDAGPLALGAVIYNMNGHKGRSLECLDRLKSIVTSVLPMSSETYDELLYGRAGYLYSLLYVRKYLGEQSVSDKIINDVVDSMVESGNNQDISKSSSSRLAYKWHGSEYIGAAHGYIGILYLMLHTDYKRHDEAIKSTLQFILDLQYPSGNFPSSCGSDKDKLVHWCHGAPGGIYLMIKAYSEFKEDKYLTSAQKAADTIWERGLLKKGYGICHGAAGNGYAFLAMYNLTKDPKYLYRAIYFGLWCCDYKRRQGLRIPDRPYSMFEGIAGTAYFLSDLFQHEKAAFPAFEL